MRVLGQWGWLWGVGFMIYLGRRSTEQLHLIIQVKEGLDDLLLLFIILFWLFNINHSLLQDSFIIEIKLILCIFGILLQLISFEVIDCLSQLLHAELPHHDLFNPYFFKRYIINIITLIHVVIQRLCQYSTKDLEILDIVSRHLDLRNQILFSLKDFPFFEEFDQLS